LNKVENSVRVIEAFGRMPGKLMNLLVQLREVPGDLGSMIEIIDCSGTSGSRSTHFIHYFRTIWVPGLSLYSLWI